MLSSHNFGQNHLSFSNSPVSTDEPCEAELMTAQLCKLCVCGSEVCVGGGMSKDLTAPEKKPAGGPLFVCTVTILPRLFSQEEQVRGPSGSLALNSWTDPQGKLRSRPENKEAGWRPRVRRHSLREGVPEPGATCPIL